MPKLAIYRYLDISTGHITQSDATLLEHDQRTSAAEMVSTNCPLIIHPKDNGWFVHIEQIPQAGVEDLHHLMQVWGASQSLIDIIDLARDNECYWICFDGDGEVYDNLPKFDW